MLIRDIPIVMVRSLIITLVVECLFAFLLGYRKKDLLNVLLVNILTNPLVNSITIMINVYYGVRYRNIALLVLEILALVVEGMIYSKYLEKRKINGYLLSLILNASSYLIGIWINNLIYWRRDYEKKIKFIANRNVINRNF